MSYRYFSQILGIRRRHNKRRLIQPEFIAMVGPKIATGGIIHLATDWQPYAEHMLEVMEGAAGFSNVEAPGCFFRAPKFATGNQI